MTISVGSTLPDATLLMKDADNVTQPVAMGARLKGRSVVIFGLPGAYTSTCSTAHLPSFMRVANRLRAGGVDEIICVSVNDPAVMKAWGEATGAAAAGITLLGDADSSFTKAIGMQFTSPASGFFDRSMRYALHAVDGVVTVLNMGKESSACEISGGEAMAEAIGA